MNKRSLARASGLNIKGIKKIGPNLYDIEFTLGDGVSENAGNQNGVVPNIAQSMRSLFPILGAPRRNAPCPCGSGKKFKRCCEGNAA